MKKTILSLLSAAFLLSNTAISAQDINFPRPSPTATIKQSFATSHIELNYSRPGVKGRKIFGDLIPFGEVWRTGANAATTIEFGQKVNFGGVDVEKGKYGLLSIPGEKNWTIILTKDLNITSANAYKKENDIARVNVPVKSLTASHETFTIEINDISDNSSSLDIKWENTSVTVQIKADFEADLIAQIEKVMSSDNRPYYAAASYYFNNKKDMKKALEWINIADAQSPDRYWIMNLKAKIQYENNQLNEANETAAKAKEAAEKAGNKNYAKEMGDLMKEIQGRPDFKAPAKGKKKKK
jgi:hypothetical protein